MLSGGRCSKGHFYTERPDRTLLGKRLAILPVTHLADVRGTRITGSVTSDTIDSEL